MVISGPVVIAATGARKQRSNHQTDSGPTCRLVSSPEAGPGATVGTLNQGYPLLQHKGIAPMRRLLAARRTTPNSTGWAGQRAPCGEERHHASVRPDPHRGPPSPYIQIGSEPPGRSEPRQGSGTRGPWGMQGSDADTCAGLALRSPRRRRPAALAHGISYRAKPDQKSCDLCIY
jgi:hypothetical protein